MPRGTIGLALALSIVMAPFAGRSALGAEKASPPKGQAIVGKKGASADEFKNNPQLLFRVALRFNQRGLYARVLPLLELFVRNFPKHAEHQRAVFMLADAHYFIAKTGVAAQYGNAAKAYVLALSLYPNAPQMAGAYFRLGQVYKTTDQPAEALVAFRTLVEKAPDSPQAPNALLEVADRYLSVSDPRSAIVEYSKILKRYKGTVAEKDAFFGVANALSRQKLFKEALQQFDAGKKKWPGYLKLRTDLLFNYSETLFQARRFKEAGQSFLRMVNISPTAEFTHRALARLGDIELELGRLENAAKIYMRVVTKYPKTEGAWVSLIRMADLAVDNKIDVSDDWVFPVEPLRDPISAYRRVVREASESRLSHVAFLRIANYYLKQEELRKSIGTVNKFLGKYPSTPLLNNAHLILARAYFGQIGNFYSQQQFLRVVWSYAEFRTIIPDNVSLQAKPYNTMLEVGESYMRLGLYKRADKIFKEVMTDPRGVLSVGGEAIFRMAQSALLSGNIGDARTLAGKFVARFPDGKRAASIRAILGEIAWLGKQPRLSISHLTEALKGELDSELRGRSLFILSEVFSDVFRYGESIEALRKAIVLYPQIPGSVKPFSLEKARFRLGDLLYEGRQKIGSLVAYKEALEAYPKSKLSGWALHRIGRVHAQLKLVRKIPSPAKVKLAANVPVDPFWREINRLRSDSIEWDKANRPRLDKLLESSVAN